MTLGVWQVQRLAWKEDLIARLDKRLAAAPERAPGADRWDAITKVDDEYRKVALTGTFDHSRETLVGASTEPRHRLLGADAAAHRARRLGAGQPRLRAAGIQDPRVAHGVGGGGGGRETASSACCA